MTSTATPKLVRHQGRVIALDDMAAKDIVGALTPGQRANLSGKLNQAGIAPAALSSDPRRARVQIVAHAVANNDACKGKADLALAMLADDDYAAISATGIIKLLGKAPAPVRAAVDPDAAARAEMRGAIYQTPNSTIDAGSGPSSRATRTSSASAVWDKVIAKTTGQA